MRKVLIITLFVLFLGASNSYAKTPIANDGFRIKARGKLSLYGMPVSLKVRAPNLKINLKTYTTPGIDRTTGTKMEFDTRGRYVNTGINGQFDAIDAVLPAPWQIHASPYQKLCINSSPASEYLEEGNSYKFECKYDISRELLITPNTLYVTSRPDRFVTLFGEDRKGAGLFNFQQNIGIRFYKKSVINEIYYLIDDGDVLNITDSRIGIKFISQRQIFSILSRGDFIVLFYTKDKGGRELYLGHGKFKISQY